MKKFTNGSIVYINTPKVTAERCQVLSCNNRGVCLLSALDNHKGEYFRKEESEIFDTKEEAIKIYKAGNKAQIKKYYSQIQDIKDLLYFPLEHTIRGKDIEREARKAYEIKMMEYLGI